jgi:non-ribosomal peptide synthetase component F
MLLRNDGDAVICIGQASHAWLSGQLARAWRDVDPREEVCLAAEQHDVGMARWDRTPTLNAETGRPQSFMEMPLDVHLELWSNAPQQLFTQSLYAACLVSMHGTALYEMRDLAKLEPGQAAAVRTYLAEQRALQGDLARRLGVGEEELRRNQQLLWRWDWLSLALCLDWDRGDALDPWPFAAGAVTVKAEGLRLEGRFEDEAKMWEALREAERVELSFRLDRATSRTT